MSFFMEHTDFYIEVLINIKALFGFTLSKKPKLRFVFLIAILQSA